MSTLTAAPAELPVAAAAFCKMEPLEALRRALGAGQPRRDGRKSSETRRAETVLDHVASADASALVRWGDTQVVCGVKAEVAAPLQSSPDSGFVVANVDVSPLASATARPGQPSAAAQEASAALRDALNEAVDVAKLGIVSGETAWCLYVDVVCLCDDGAVFEASLHAAVLALGRLALSTVDMNEDGMLLVREGAPALPLPLRCRPAAASLGLVRLGSSVHILADPTLAEAQLCDALVSVVVDPAARCILSQSVTPLTSAFPSASVSDLSAWVNLARSHALARIK